MKILIRIFLIWYLILIGFAIPGVAITFQLMQNAIVLRARFFPLLYQKLDLRIKDSALKNLQNFKRPFANSSFDIHDSYGFKFLRRLCPDLSHLHKHKFRHRYFKSFMCLQYDFRWHIYLSIALSSTFVDKPSFRILEILLNGL